MKLHKALFIFTIAVLVLALPTDSHACAGCRNPNMPVTKSDSANLQSGQLLLGATFGLTTVGVVHQAGCADLSNCDETPAQRQHLHDQDMVPMELKINAEYGFTSSLGIVGQLPFRVIRTDISYTTPDGEPYEPVNPGIHHRDETLAGFGDPWLLVRWSETITKFRLTAHTGLSIPLAHTEPNPFKLGDEGQSHQHIQFGTGTFDPIGLLEITRMFDTVFVSAYGQVQASLYQNTQGFKSGLRSSLGLKTGLQFAKAYSAALGIEGWHEAAERWDGEILQDGNLGRTELMVLLSFTKTFESSSLGFSIRIPFYRHLETGDDPTGELTSPLMLAVSYNYIIDL